MDLLLVRHGIAQDASGVGREADAQRRLTTGGRRRMRDAARGLRQLVPRIELVATSPLQRAVDTAEIVAEICRAGEVVEVPALAPGARLDALLGWLSRRRDAALVALVGHEPHLSRVAALLVAGATEPFFTLRKGGAVLLHVEGTPAPGSAQLGWLATASLLRKLGAARGRA